MTEKSFFAGLGGQGIISLGQMWVYCAMKEGRNVTFFPFYGAEKRGGIARASVIVSDEEIASPLVSVPDSAIVMHSDSLTLCENMLKKNGFLVINSSLVKESPNRKDITLLAIPAQEIAEKLGGARFANMVALGALAKVTHVLTLDNIESSLSHFFAPDKQQFVTINADAIRAGFAAV
ncbi:MAG: 2-oxoacid:acceptor oxidoreductase family protein [Treponema sp.]|jgi:2-oxoglutarate ferredoxin oxidoreductase subunit gamma|nr:2-oxoacid:acceptor oxidoreductase family protein [Treponema sp.]